MSGHARILPVLIASALPFCSTVSLADVREGNWEVGFGVGATNFDSNVADETGTYLDVRGGYFFSDLFELEGQLSGAVTDGDVIDVGLASLFANAVFNFHPREHVVPYALVGVGSTTLEFEILGTSFDDEATSFQAALGSRFFVGAQKKMAVRVELSGMSEDTFGESSTHVSVAAGLTWRLGPVR